MHEGMCTIPMPALHRMQMNSIEETIDQSFRRKKDVGMDLCDPAVFNPTIAIKIIILVIKFLFKCYY
jgi:hypothetical protein